MTALHTFLTTPFLGTSAWLWLIFVAIVVGLLVLDLGVDMICAGPTARVVYPREQRNRDDNQHADRHRARADHSPVRQSRRS